MDHLVFFKIRDGIHFQACISLKRTEVLTVLNRNHASLANLVTQFCSAITLASELVAKDAGSVVRCFQRSHRPSVFYIADTTYRTFELIDLF